MLDPELTMFVVTQGWRGLREAEKQGAGSWEVILYVAIGVGVLWLFRKLNSPPPDPMDEIKRQATRRHILEHGESEEERKQRLVQKAIRRHERKRAKARR